MFSVFLTRGLADNGTGSAKPSALRLPIGMGVRGSYLELTRTWMDGDLLHFALPMQLRVTQYTGLTVIPGHQRFAVEFGPILLCVVGGGWNRSIDSMLIRGVTKPLAPETWLTPPNSSLLHKRGDGDHDASPLVSTAFKRRLQMDALRFGVVGNPELSFVPYFLVQEEVFEVYPAFGSRTPNS